MFDHLVGSTLLFRICQFPGWNYQLEMVISVSKIALSDWSHHFLSDCPKDQAMSQNRPVILIRDGHGSPVKLRVIILLRNKDPLTSYFNSGMGLIHSHVLHFGIQESVICPIANGHQQSLPKNELSAYEPVLKCTKLGFRLGCSSYFGAGLVSWLQHIDGQNFTQLHKL